MPGFPGEATGLSRERLVLTRSGRLSAWRAAELLLGAYHRAAERSEGAAGGGAGAAGLETFRGFPSQVVLACDRSADRLATMKAWWMKVRRIAAVILATFAMSTSTSSR